ncbi:MAG: histidinol-phosphate aminotransferase [Firmicutes bacterium]|nr:histidinol-phosphate aminotransferase [Bacillota bacterium]
MSKYWSKLAARLEPYVPGEQLKDKKYIKLNTNENPYPPSPKALEAIKAAADGSLKLYPDPLAADLRSTLAEHYGLKSSQVFVGNGSDEVLAFSFMAFFNAEEEVLFPDVTYSFYPVYANIFNISYRLVPLAEDFSLPVEGFFNAEGGVIIPNPNAPTARAISSKDIEMILVNNKDKVVIVDEAYVDFGAESVVELVDKHENLLVVQTLSKSRSLAGLRVGWAFGQEDLIDGLTRVKDSINSYTLDRLALIGAAEAIKDEDYFQETRERIMATRERITASLENLGFKVIPSKANFIFITHENTPAEDIFKRLREEGVLVRYFNKPGIDNYLRVSIGTDEEMDAMIEKLLIVL